MADRVRNIYFPFDIEMDTALSVATEMVAELDITDQDVTKIADMIDGEIASMVPEWKPGPGIEETPRCATSNMCHYCTVSRQTWNDDCIMAFQKLQCSNGCAGAVHHGRFEEITCHQVEAGEGDGEHIGDERRSLENGGACFSDDQELRWLKAKYDMELSGLRDVELGLLDNRPKNNGVVLLKSCNSAAAAHRRASSDMVHVVATATATATTVTKDSINRTTSLPVDAVDL